MTVKKCSKCKSYLLLSEFSKNKNMKDGRSHYCKSCSKDARQKWLVNNIEAAREATRRWYKNNIEKAHSASRKWKKINSEKEKETMKKYVENNKEKVREAQRNWRKNNPDKARLSSLNSVHKNPDAKKAKDHRRKAKKRGNGGSFSPVEWKELREKYGNKCLCCGEEKKLEADHVIPVIKGGTSNIENIQPLCRSCNAKKSSSEIDYRKVLYG